MKNKEKDSISWLLPVFQHKLTKVKNELFDKIDQCLACQNIVKDN